MRKCFSSICVTKNTFKRNVKNEMAKYKYDLQTKLFVNPLSYSRKKSY